MVADLRKLAGDLVAAEAAYAHGLKAANAVATYDAIGDAITRLNAVRVARDTALRALAAALAEPAEPDATAERAAIVAWLRSFDPAFVSSMQTAANSIERGLHHTSDPRERR